MADGAGPYEDGDSPPPRPRSHSHADYAFDDHRENGDRDRKREVLSSVQSLSWPSIFTLSLTVLVLLAAAISRAPTTVIFFSLALRLVQNVTGRALRSSKVLFSSEIVDL